MWQDTDMFSRKGAEGAKKSCIVFYAMKPSRFICLAFFAIFAALRENMSDHVLGYGQTRIRAQESFLP